MFLERVGYNSVFLSFVEISKINNISTEIKAMRVKLGRLGEDI